MQLLQLSPLWNRDHHWQGILATGSLGQLQSLDVLLAESAIANHFAYYADSPELHARVLQPFSEGQWLSGVDQAGQLDAMREDQLAFGRWYTVAGEQMCASAKPELLELMSLVAADAETEALERIFSRTPELTFRLLKLVNSVGMRSRIQIDSIRHAITVLGRNQLKRWVQLLMYAEQFSESDRIAPLLLAALLRARRLESWVQHGWLNAPAESAFLLGMLSLLDQLFKKPLPELVASLPLGDEMSAALLEKSGVLGQALTQSIDMEVYLGNVRWVIRPLDQPELWVKSELEVYRWVGMLAESMQR
ncbi:HDOD domain-containing protein [Chitinibacter sp. S2-10]|uniref:HDOD domain-containing protein n=1 Tax=Chitinibacter sp. S2-10 TaxID=3373597 RepID=UPI003977359B